MGADCGLWRRYGGSAVVSGAGKAEKCVQRWETTAREAIRFLGSGGFAGSIFLESFSAWASACRRDSGPVPGCWTGGRNFTESRLSQHTDRRREQQ